ncbi:hypothetical protein [Pseudoclavibacter helvolus]|uniref:Uncharacterized protein n=1 Tax=Pseudoclavibacter helvolus TaxID=255205 RepID=A0A7W4YEX8_9MICO|nr:hypothetical protein [Pseudoclavibacter helvolus]MBB2956973.1 hypothetical protein [Pseudoclavibacter helvolus]
MLSSDDLSGIPQGTARVVLVYARSIAPGIDLLEGEAKAAAVEILLGAAREAVTAAPRRIANQGLGSARVGYREVASWFSAQERDGLRSLTGDTTSARKPVGSFPTARPLRHLWPEEDRR